MKKIVFAVFLLLFNAPNANALHQSIICLTNNDCSTAPHPECLFVESIQKSVCSNPGYRDFCTLQSDCKVLGKTDCLQHSGSRMAISDEESQDVQSNASSSEPGQPVSGFGVCGIQFSTSETNVMADALCNLFRFATGKTGRLILGIVVTVVGIMFYLGKVSWGTVAATAIGAGAMFGSSTIVGVLAGKGFSC